jgi:4-amino-4-deoxy-L-arabinose transferase-like glycosyltransferase
LYSKFCVAIIGVILPFIFALWLILENRLKKSLSPSILILTTVKNSSNEKIPLALWFFFGFLVFFTRFYKLTSIPSWPTNDEGIFATMALELLKKWNWSILWGEVRFEPFLIWGLGGFFKIIPPSLLSLRLFPAFVSIVTILLSYWASRQYFSKRTSFIFCWIFAFSFWEF